MESQHVHLERAHCISSTEYDEALGYFADLGLAPIIIRRHYVCHAINLQKLQETAAAKNISITYCKAEVVINCGLSMHQLYSIIQGPKKALADAILSVIPGAPLMITKNLNHLPVPLVNGAIIEFYGFGNDGNRASTSTIVDLPQYVRQISI